VVLIVDSVEKVLMNNDLPMQPAIIRYSQACWVDSGDKCL